jgi:hypothetical protein
LAVKREQAAAVLKKQYEDAYQHFEMEKAQFEQN